MPNKYFEDQLENEEVLYVFHKHPIVMRKGLIFFMFSLLGGTLPSLVNPQFSWFFGGIAIGFFVGIILFMPGWISWHFSVFIFTNQRLIQITQKGLFHRSVVDMGLNQIQLVNYQVSGIQETLLGSGTIMMQTFVGDLIIHDVHHPAKVQKRILEILREQGVIANSYSNSADKKLIINQDEGEEIEET
ncbi:MAG: PH domain-containing protein [bacterium]